MITEEELQEAEREESENGPFFHEDEIHLHELLQTIRELQRRVAELEADAKLGRMVRGIENGYCLAHSVRSGRFFYGPWAEIRVRSEGDTPEAALEAAQKGET